jgi:hypothetical protein
MTTKQIEKRMLKYKMRDYRSRIRLSEFQSGLHQLKEKIAKNEVSISGEAKDIFQHLINVADQI